VLALLSSMFAVGGHTAEDTAMKPNVLFIASDNLNLASATFRSSQIRTRTFSFDSARGLAALITTNPYRMIAYTFMRRSTVLFCGYKPVEAVVLRSPRS
jgi:hypothetical protein